MCGILGGFNAAFDESSLVRLRHRGPDQRDLHTIQIDQGLITLGQTRLNVVDRHDIDLPVRIGDNVVLFNGEIYNHPELRDQLRSHGWEFRTQTDTEVVLAAYLHWGPECLSRFNGMFAIAIWDGRQIFCARDRLGQKPLYYRRRNGSFEFASEIKALPEAQFTSNELFELFEFCFNDHTLYRDVRALRPGHYLIFNPETGTCRSTEYWNLEHHVTGIDYKPREAIETFIALLEDSVRLRMRSDVPVSMFLAGGLDSPLIARLSGVEESFTCQFDEFKIAINEEEYVRDLSERIGLKAHMVRPTRDQFFNDLEALAYHLEMPTGSFSVFALYRLAAAARGRGYKVILSGEGSDELFSGYVRNELLLGEPARPAGAKEEHYAGMMDRYRGTDLARFCRMASRSGLSGAARMEAYLADHWSPARTALQNISLIESGIFLQPLLQMGDRMCMAQGVENRCPFLDYRLVEFAFSLSDDLRFREGTGKWIVHKAAEKLLPAGTRLLQRSIKDGLPTPINLWVFGSHSFDRRHWNSLMTAECIKSMQRSRTIPHPTRVPGGQAVSTPRTAPRGYLEYRPTRHNRPTPYSVRSTPR